MKLSIVTTMYHSAPYLREFYERITKVARKITKDYEIIFVNDGSPDESLEIIKVLLGKDRKIKIIDLSRNYGHHKAIMTGLSHVKGEYIFLIDCDLEEEPELLEKFWDEIKKTDNTDVIYGVQKLRVGHLSERIFGYLYYSAVNFFSDIKIPRNLLTIRLMTRRYVDALVNYKENEFFFSGICSDAGFKQNSLEVIKHDNSPTTYNFRKRFSLIINSITSFSNKPLVFVFYLGFIITFIMLIFIMKIVLQKVLFNIGIEGWTSLIVSVWFLGGIIIFCIGIVGIYLSKIFIETKQRPYVVIRNKYND